jgi:hypothetical protein
MSSSAATSSARLSAALAGGEELAPLHVVTAQHDQKPGAGHRQFAQPARHQPQRRRRVGPGQQQPGHAQQQHAGGGPVASSRPAGTSTSSKP